MPKTNVNPSRIYKKMLYSYLHYLFVAFISKYLLLLKALSVIVNVLDKPFLFQIVPLFSQQNYITVATKEIG